MKKQKAKSFFAEKIRTYVKAFITYYICTVFTRGMEVG